MDNVRKPPESASFEARLPTISSRLHPPLASPREIARADICDEIFSAGGARLVLVTAPAGFGKTSVMRQVRQRCESGGLASTWLNVEPADNDVTRFLASLTAALEVLMPDLSLDSDETRFDADGGRYVGSLLERIGRHGEPLVLFLDDFEVIQSGAVLTIVRQIIQSLPLGAQLVVGSRNMPNLGLGRLRAHGWLLEVESTKLRFTEQESGAFLRTSRSLKLGDEEIKRLHAKTEGWAAALWLASLALGERLPSATSDGAGRGQIDEFIARFSGSDAAIADYLGEDVLAHLSEDLRGFLLRTSILNPLSAESCDAVCGRNDSQLLLERLEHGNLFLMRLDDQRRQYRYHGLFSEFLRGQLRRLLPDEVPRLHHAASNWYEAQGRPVPAIEHAMNSGDLSHALPLLSKHALGLLADARMGLLARWLGAVPADALNRHPMLRAIHAWAVNFTRGPREAMALIENIDARTPLDDEARDQFAALRTVLLLRMDRIDEAEELGRAHIDRLLSRPGFASSVLATLMGTIGIMRGDYAGAQSFLAKARRLQAPFAGSFSIVLSESIEGAMDLLQGNLRQAMARARGTLEPRGHDRTRYAKGNALGGVLLAEALYETDQRAEAERLLTGYLPTITEGGLPDQLITAHVVMARLLALRGEYEQAFHMLMELEYVGHSLGLPRVVGSAKLERARQALDVGNVEAATLELESAADSQMWARFSPLYLVGNDADTYEIGVARLAIRNGRPEEAIPRLKLQLEAADAEGRTRRALKLRILLAEALYLGNERKRAVAVFDKALALGAQEGFVRTFIDEGPNIAKLIQEWRQSPPTDGGTIPAAYVDRLQPPVEEASAASSPATDSDLIEPLSRKETMVLRLLAEGLSNRVLAERLFLSETTIRSHLRNINVKLGVHSRMQAIVVARRHGLLG